VSSNGNIKKNIDQKNVKTFIKNKKLYFTFMLSVSVRATEKLQDVRLSVYDETYYSDIKTQLSNIKTRNKGKLKVQYKIEKNIKRSFYFGSLHPTEIILTFKK
jgi:ABC-type uncharacterized transport system substrate-binding protein